ncbi:MAG: sigma 54-interacting transcriptional regulator [Candidatus Eiseniibacteriota bacterium]
MAIEHQRGEDQRPPAPRGQVAARTRRSGSDDAAPAPDSRSRRDLGELYWKALDFEQAERQFEARLAQSRGVERAVVLRRIGQCRERRGAYVPAIEVLRTAEDEARAAGDRREEGRAAYVIAKVHFLTGDLAAAREVALRARTLLVDSPDPGERGAIENLLGGVAYRDGDLQRARRHFEEALLLGKDSNDLTLLSRAHNNLGLIHKALCDFEQAIDSFHASLGFDSTAANYDTRYTAWINLGIVHGKRSEWQEAESMYRRALKTCVEVGNPLGQVRSLLGLASVHRALGDHDAAAERLAEAEQLALAHRYRREAILVTTSRAWIDLDRGDLESCQGRVDEARSAAELIAPGGELTCHVLRLAATCELERGHVEAAGATAAACRELADRCADRFERAAVARVEAAALAASGHFPEAEKRFAQGARELRRMGERQELARTLRDWAASEGRLEASRPSRGTIDRLREAAHLFDQIDDANGLAPTYLAMADIEHRRGEDDQALAALRQAWNHVEQATHREPLESAIADLQRRIEERLLRGAAPECNRIVGLVSLLENIAYTGPDPSGGPGAQEAPTFGRLLDQIGELVGADGALLASQSSSDRTETEVASGLRLAERRDIIEALKAATDFLRAHAGTLVFAVDARGSELELAGRLAARRTAGSIAVLPVLDARDRLWVLYLDRDRSRNPQAAFSHADVEILSTLAGRLSGLIARIASRMARAATEVGGDPAQDLELGDFVCADRHVREILRNVAQIRGSSIRVLLQGETGTGKGVLARIIHRNSVRRDRGFRVLNCATLPETLLESELFGHLKGSFTGATSDKIGLLEEANGGTIFLDDIEKAGSSVQRGLLHFLDCGEIRPVGSTRRRSLDVRVICATSSANLEENVRQGTFSKDLFYRLHHFTITVPPIRERRDSILPLAEHFLSRFAAEQGGTPRAISAEARALIESAEWPGNVRELENAMRLAAVLGREAEVVEPAHLPAGLGRQDPVAQPVPVVQGTLQEQVDALEAARVREGLALHSGNKSRTAAYLGLTRKGLRNKMRRFGITDAG